MDQDISAKSEEETWLKTREAITRFRTLLLCSKCSNILTEPVCLGMCEHLLCRSCAGPRVGEGCSVCHSPAWVKDIQINRQLSNITQLFLNLEALLCPSDVSGPSVDSCTQSDETTSTVFKQKKNFKIWFSPKSRKVRCRIQKPVDTAPSKLPQKPPNSNPLSVFNFNSSTPESTASSSSSPLGVEASSGRKKKPCGKRRVSASKQENNVPKPSTRHQSKCNLKKMRLETVNQEWGFGKEGALEEKIERTEERAEPGSGEGGSSKKVSFQCPREDEEELKSLHPPGDNQVLSPKKGILRDGAELVTKLPDPVSETKVIAESDRPSPCRAPKRLCERSPQSTPKRPRTSRGQKRRPHSASEFCRKPGDEQKESPASSPVGGKSSPATPASAKKLPGERQGQSSPAYMRRNRKGETPLHLAAIKGDVEAMRELLAQGADPNLKDHAGWTPLHEACNLGHLGAVEVLLNQGTLLNTPGYENDSPLHDAVRNGHVAVARLLLEHGASTSVLNIFGLRPVDYAVTPEMREALSVAPEAPHPITTPLSSPASLSKSGAIMRRDVQVTLMGSKLTDSQQKQLTEAARVLGGKRVETFSEAVTHVVVPDGSLPTTLTVLQGILSGCWVVHFSWLADCLQQGDWRDESRFEVGEGPRRARANRDSLLPRLFDGCFFYLLRSFQKPPKEELVRLIKAGGGRLLSRQPKPDSDVTQTLSTAAYHARPGSDQALCTQYVLYDPQGPHKPTRVRLGKVWSAPSSWLLDCITAFSLLPVPEL